ncbi:triphosphoribosyl-dephospho-CoA synthase [Halorubrum sp. JWXQ-INN 858]|uniref:triphosphoribosyl-dephospho-CoA synthase n=1 Tax=Halorubrum sp. JWXQ-INN 858 TaxID=2690782 RepID=UPI00135A8DFE|nr:triphosphoribosyl-dephospho-CoA synthase [Halorubrum sp. JWXQ-INN 858]MWV63967.1 triphosphoribosyl-dephospho-CoA synthase [Halorubrum sp. JWXQ-INN 858]
MTGGSDDGAEGAERADGAERAEEAEDRPQPARSPVDDATLALLLEVAGTPKPGNVDRRRDLADLRFESFLGGAVGARDGLARAARGGAVGDAFERAVTGMADRAGTNTQFGCLLLLTPLVRATAAGDLSPGGVDRVARATTVDDAVAFYRAFERVDVAVGDPPADAAALDVRRGGDAEPTLRERDLDLRDVLALSASPSADATGAEPTEGKGGADGAAAADAVPDRNAQEWIDGFPRTFRAARWIAGDEGPVADRAARAFLRQLAREPDTLVATARGPDVAREASRRAAALVDDGGRVDLAAAEDLAEAFVAEGINPGTTADLTCAALYVALRRGVEVRS